MMINADNLKMKLMNSSVLSCIDSVFVNSRHGISNDSCDAL